MGKKKNIKYYDHLITKWVYDLIIKVNKTYIESLLTK